MKLVFSSSPICRLGTGRGSATCGDTSRMSSATSECYDKASPCPTHFSLPDLRMWIVRLALRRPYTFVVRGVLLIAILGGAAIVQTMPVDIFPYIDIPIVSVVWQYSGSCARGDGGPHRLQLRARAHFQRQRHRAISSPSRTRASPLSVLFPSQRADSILPWPRSCTQSQVVVRASCRPEPFHRRF